MPDSFRYYVQTLPPVSVRRYAEDRAQRWIGKINVWVPECAPEKACLTTGDEQVRELDVRRRFPEIVV